MMQSSPGRFSRALDAVERVGNRLPDPVLIFLWLIVAVVALSVVYFPLVLAFCQRWVPGFGIGTLVAAMLPQ